MRGAAHPGPVRELDAHGIALFFDAGLCLIDVRDPEEFNACHLRGSINLPASGPRLGTRAAYATSGDQPIVLVTPSYEAGRAAAELLRAAGVPNLAGMTVADPQGWEAAGLSVSALTRAAECARYEAPRTGSDASPVSEPAASSASARA